MDLINIRKIDSAMFVLTIAEEQETSGRCSTDTDFQTLSSELVSKQACM